MLLKTGALSFLTTVYRKCLGKRLVILCSNVTLTVTVPIRCNGMCCILDTTSAIFGLSFSRKDAVSSFPHEPVLIAC